MKLEDIGFMNFDLGESNGPNGSNELEERKLTAKEKAKRDEIVDSMSPAEFKRRYGENWKQVMYAAATKNAKTSAKCKKKTESTSAEGAESSELDGLVNESFLMSIDRLKEIHDELKPALAKIPSVHTGAMEILDDILDKQGYLPESWLENNKDGLGHAVKMLTDILNGMEEVPASPGSINNLYLWNSKVDMGETATLETKEHGAIFSAMCTLENLLKGELILIEDKSQASSQINQTNQVNESEPSKIGNKWTRNDLKQNADVIFKHAEELPDFPDIWKKASGFIGFYAEKGKSDPKRFPDKVFQDQARTDIPTAMDALRQVTPGPDDEDGNPTYKFKIRSGGYKPIEKQTVTALRIYYAVLMQIASNEIQIVDGDTFESTGTGTGTGIRIKGAKGEQVNESKGNWVIMVATIRSSFSDDEWKPNQFISANHQGLTDNINKAKKFGPEVFNEIYNEIRELVGDGWRVERTKDWDAYGGFSLLAIKNKPILHKINKMKFSIGKDHSSNESIESNETGPAVVVVNEESGGVKDSNIFKIIDDYKGAGDRYATIDGGTTKDKNSHKLIALNYHADPESCRMAMDHWFQMHMNPDLVRDRVTDEKLYFVHAYYDGHRSIAGSIKYHKTGSGFYQKEIKWKLVPAPGFEESTRSMGTRGEQNMNKSSGTGELNEKTVYDMDPRDRFGQDIEVGPDWKADLKNQVTNFQTIDYMVNEDNNYHTLNAMMLAYKFGDMMMRERMEEIYQKKYVDEVELTQRDLNTVNMVHQKHWRKLEAKASPQDYLDGSFEKCQAKMNESVIETSIETEGNETGRIDGNKDGPINNHMENELIGIGSRVANLDSSEMLGEVKRIAHNDDLIIELADGRSHIRRAPSKVRLWEGENFMVRANKALNDCMAEVKKLYSKDVAEYVHERLARVNNKLKSHVYGTSTDVVKDLEAEFSAKPGNHVINIAVPFILQRLKKCIKEGSDAMLFAGDKIAISEDPEVVIGTVERIVNENEIEVKLNEEFAGPAPLNESAGSAGSSAGANSSNIVMMPMASVVPFKMGTITDQFPLEETSVEVLANGQRVAINETPGILLGKVWKGGPATSEIMLTYELAEAHGEPILVVENERLVAYEGETEIQSPDEIADALEKAELAEMIDGIGADKLEKLKDILNSRETASTETSETNESGVNEGNDGSVGGQKGKFLCLKGEKRFETIAESSFDAAKKAGAEWGLSGTSGIDVFKIS